MKANSFKEELKDLFEGCEYPEVFVFGFVLLPFIFIWWLVDKLKSLSVNKKE